MSAFHIYELRPHLYHKKTLVVIIIVVRNLLRDKSTSNIKYITRVCLIDDVRKTVGEAT